MSRQKVPHCRECEHFKIYNYSNGWFFRSQRNDGFKCLCCDRFINYQQAKTSPKWCPKRNNPYNV